MVDRLTWKSRPLLDPLQGLRGGKRVRRLPDHGHEELLQDLRRSAEVRRFNELNSTSSLRFVFAHSYRRIDQDVGVEEGANGHANLPWSKFSYRAAPETAC